MYRQQDTGVPRLEATGPHQAGSAIDWRIAPAMFDTAHIKQPVPPIMGPAVSSPGTLPRCRIQGPRG